MDSLFYVEALIKFIADFVPIFLRDQIITGYPCELKKYEFRRDQVSIIIL